MQIQNSTFVVTGASSGIGLQVAHELAKKGAKLILIARTESELQKFLEEYGNLHTYFICDLSQEKQVVELVKKIKAAVLKIDGLLNIAGVGIYNALENITLQEWNETFDLGVKAPFLLTQGLIADLRSSQHSLVLNIGSGAGVTPMVARSLYCASKFALRGFTLSLAEEFKGKSPLFCLITLGSTATNFGGTSIEEKKAQAAKGKAYFSVQWVAQKLVSIIEDDAREVEITLVPSNSI